MANEIEKRNEAFLIYQDVNGIARVNVRFEGEDVWLTVEQIMELFDASQQDVSYHIKQIYADGEQDAQERSFRGIGGEHLWIRTEGDRGDHGADQHQFVGFADGGTAAAGAGDSG